MRNLVIMAVAAGLVLPTAASAQQRSPAEQAAWNARLESREAYAAQQRRDDRREEWRDDRRDAREDRRDDRREWRRDQREDRRDYRQARRDYRDWRAYRQAERNAFRRGAYYAPRGLAYRPVRVGGRLNSNLFWGSRYWVDPYDYYLPQPRYGYQRYIRYGNDVLLIDTRNGRVLVVYDRFFW
ncbi:RcnB family protein [Citromicrobium sp. WPS32]|uniref:RcnB family protein n=1 Tax=Citromicrobium sp. WPS32 TaxID=1634517 RepID=UPI0006C9308C|nr:RcnB family protein [Citromicrobium sp. WPS32]KPM18314.1 hypothetical protein WG75_03640 [Citromicrobium sp. WPS32]MAY76809.1 hypothetical protein [Citromicrobium sp.]|tara:strand:- start:5351 stop:5899 length:549 start_codon:yes stop_codon:yes gene_type:complete